MELHHLPFIIPFFFLFIWIENKIATKSGGVYSFEDTVLNLCCGVMERTVDMFYYVVMYYFFDWIYHSFALLQIDEANWVNWIIAAVLLDFMYYWYHRAGHLVNILWAAHVTHHQSEDFNLTVGFRNSNIPMIYKTIFWLPVPLLGFSPEMIIVGITISGIWQFFLHTTVVNRLGFLENILVTPSAHRVHHGSNEQYLDKNFGAIFIIWDRLFGTYAKEDEPIKYGLTKPFKERQPLRAWFHYWSDLFRASKQEKNWVEKIKIWFRKPGTIRELRLQTTNNNFGILNHKIYVIYVASQVVLLMLSLTAVLICQEYILFEWKIVIGVLLFLSGISICSFLDMRKEGWQLEVAKHAITICFLLFYEGWIIWFIAVPVFSLIWLFLIRNGEIGNKEFVKEFNKIFITK